MYDRLSKAFDKVYPILLCKKLYTKVMCPLILRFIINMYVHQCIRVKWTQSTSDLYRITNGVKQGVAMSSLLFYLYVCDLLEHLQSSGLGCHMGSKVTGFYLFITRLA